MPQPTVPEIPRLRRARPTFAPWRPRRRNAGRRWNERGSVAALVAVVFGGCVTMGTAALVVDVGQVYVEREQLQSGADAAAIALATGCASDASACATQTSRAQALANSNAKDGLTTVTEICGTGPGLPACTETLASRSDCIGSVPAGIDYVEVHTATETSDGNLLAPTFARALAGNGGYSGRTYNACARAAWGAPGSGTGLGLTISKCDWDEMTDGGTNFGPVPPSTTDAILYERKMWIHGSTNSSPDAACQTQTPSGWEAPGGFGWLAENAGPCKTKAVTGDPNGFPTDPGNNFSSNCQSAFNTAYTSYPTTLMMPVYDGYKGTGNNTVYHIVGFSAFVLTGWYFGPSKKVKSAVRDLHGDSNAWPTQCSSSNTCVFGYFTTGVMPVEGNDIVSTPGYGATIVKMVG